MNNPPDDPAILIVAAVALVLFVATLWAVLVLDRLLTIPRKPLPSDPGSS